MSEPDCSQQDYAEAQYDHDYRQLQAEIERLRGALQDIAEMRVTVLPSLFMDESMAAYARKALGTSADQPAHQWREAHGPIKWPHCSVCGVIQRRDGRNGPCKGPAAVTTRTDQPEDAVK